MNALYIFPHPDDESFGPASVMAKQRRDGHDVHLLTLTRGGATKVRFELGLSVEEMGEVRLAEMREVEKVLDLSGMNVLDLPDSGLKELDPREIERIVTEEIERLRPDVVVSYAVFGVSGFEDHLVMHAVAKRAYVELRSGGGWSPQRLAFYTIRNDDPVIAGAPFGLRGSKPEEIDCEIALAPEDVDAQRRALECYKSYRGVIERAGILDHLPTHIPFEFYQEKLVPPVDDLFAGLG